MASYAMIDADSHVEEPLDVREHLDVEFAKRKPIPVTIDERQSMGEMNAFWLVDVAGNGHARLWYNIGRRLMEELTHHGRERSSARESRFAVSVIDRLAVFCGQRSSEIWAAF